MIVSAFSGGPWGRMVFAKIAKGVHFVNVVHSFSKIDLITGRNCWHYKNMPIQ